MDTVVSLKYLFHNLIKRKPLLLALLELMLIDVCLFVYAMNLLPFKDVAAGAPQAVAATGAGSSRSTATAPAKRARDPTPPPRRTGGEPDFDLSTLSSDKEEEE